MKLDSHFPRLYINPGLRKSAALLRPTPTPPHGTSVPVIRYLGSARRENWVVKKPRCGKGGGGGCVGDILKLT